MVKVSVVIPTYNAEQTIGKAVKSVLSQTYAPYEIIVVDDCSTDNTVNVLRSFQDLKIIHLKINSGPSIARNHGWDQATGDIIAFLDSDDEWHPEKLQTISKVFFQQEDIVFLGHSYSTNTLSSLTTSPNIVEKTYASILLKNPYQPSCIVVKKNLPIRFDESYRYCEDHELSIRVAHKYKCHYLKQDLTKLGRPQLTEGGASGNKWKMRKGELRVYSSVYKHNITYSLIIPFLWLLSIGKMLRKL